MLCYYPFVFKDYIVQMLALNIYYTLEPYLEVITKFMKFKMENVVSNNSNRAEIFQWKQEHESKLGRILCVTQWTRWYICILFQTCSYGSM